MANSKIYIGVHVTQDKDDEYMGSGTLLGRAKRKYGLAVFKKEILFECKSVDEMMREEARLVNEEFLKRPDVYNICLGGFYSKPRKKDEDHRKAISRAMMGNKHALGSQRSAAHKKAVSDAHTGRIFSEETKKKMSESKKGNKNAAGHKLSEESKLKISIAKKGRPRKNPEVITQVLCDTQKS